MDFSSLQLSFKKDLAGADIVFQPEDIDDYKDDAWDIRISIGDAPLEEAYYFTVDDPKVVRLTIGELLDLYALNPELKSKLDVEEYPDLAFLQDELIQYLDSERQGRLKLEYYINCNPVDGPVSLKERAEKYICVCTYHDHSHDYRVLDLIIVPEVPEISQSEIEQRQREYGHIYLLFLLEHFLEKGPEAFRQFTEEPAMLAYQGVTWTDMSYQRFADGMRRLESDGFISRRLEGSGPGPSAEQTLPIELTAAGRMEIDNLKQESQEIADRYDKYDSVSITPVALGVPDGFDVRAQMMEYDGLDCERSVLLRVLDEARQECFEQGDWGRIYETFGFFEVVKEALAYKTNFSAEILSALKELAGDES
ncbi:MAG: hypothetical protein ACYTEL_18450 [Planctomycetota bacterium]|jgi:hypothetical protein